MAAVATALTVWAFQPETHAPAESKAASVHRNAQETDALLRTALQQQQQQNSRGAAHTYRRVLELDPHNKFAWYNLGIIAQQDGNTADAHAAYEKALTIDPSFISALYSEATLLESSRPDRAVELLRRAVAADPEATAVHMRLGHLLAEQERDDEAEDAFRRAVAADPALLSNVPQPFRDSVSLPPTSSRTGETG